MIIKNILFLCLLFSSCLTKGIEKKMPEITDVAECDSFNIFVGDLLTAKLDYEKALYFSDTTRLEKNKERYYSLVIDFKSNKSQNIKCINLELEKEELINKNPIKFSYYPEYLSSAPLCRIMSYEKCLLLLKHNLLMSESNKELICDESIFR